MKSIRWIAGFDALDVLHLGDQLRALEQHPVAGLSITLGDGRFGGDFGLGFDHLGGLAAATNLPVEVRVAAFDPQRHIARLAEAGCAAITVHHETCAHHNRVLTAIREAGCSPGLALNPVTSLTAFEYLVPLVDRVHLLAFEPGVTPQPSSGREDLPAATYDRVRILREYLDYRGSSALLQCEGGVTPATAARLVQFGAEAFVLNGAAGVNGADIANGFAGFLAAFESARESI